MKIHRRGTIGGRVLSAGQLPNLARNSCGKLGMGSGKRRRGRFGAIVGLARWVILKVYPLEQTFSAMQEEAIGCWLGGGFLDEESRPSRLPTFDVPFD